MRMIPFGERVKIPKYESFQTFWEEQKLLTQRKEKHKQSLLKSTHTKYSIPKKIKEHFFIFIVTQENEIFFFNILVTLVTLNTFCVCLLGDLRENGKNGFLCY